MNIGVWARALKNLVKRTRKKNDKTARDLSKDKADGVINTQKIPDVTPATFSSPKAEQENTIATNSPTPQAIENYEENDLWSTLDTPTSEKWKWKRPGPSTMVTRMRYNPNTAQLNVQYRDKDTKGDGKIFPYQNVSPEEVEAIWTAKGDGSIGHEILNGIFRGKGTTKNDEISDIEEGMNE